MAGVVLDVNAYRMIVHGHDSRAIPDIAAELRRGDHHSGVTPFAATTVIKELLVHVADGTDAAFDDCAKALFLVGLHCSDATGTIRIIPEAGALLSHMFTGTDVFAPQTEQVAAVCRKIVEDRGRIDGTVQDVARGVAAEMNKREQPFLSDYDSILNQPLSDKQLRKNVTQFVEQHAEDQAAHALAFVALSQRGVVPDSSDVGRAADFLRDRFSTAFAMHRRLLSKRIQSEHFFVNPKKAAKRSNFLWDLQLCFLVGAPVANSRLLLVTADKELRETAADAGAAAFVLSLDEYLRRTGAAVTAS